MQIETIPKEYRAKIIEVLTPGDRTKVAKKLGISVSAVSAFLNGRINSRNISKELLDLYSDRVKQKQYIEEMFT